MFPLRKYFNHITVLIHYLFFFAFILITSINNLKLTKDCLKCDTNESFSFFWKIDRPQPSPPSYFFGTIHAPYTKVWNYVPSKAKSAFRSSHQIIFELDLMNANTLLALTRCQLLPPGIKLSDIIPIDLYHRLQRHLKYVQYKMPLWMTEEQKSKGLFANHLFNAITLHWERKRPVWVMIMLNSLTENDIKSKGITVLDSFFYKKARKLKKSIGSVENAREQCKTLNYLNTTQVIYALNQTLVQHESIRRGLRRSNHTTDDMIRHYNCGNLNEALFNEDAANIPVLKNHSALIEPQELEIAKNIENYFRFEIILKRNRRMSQRVLELLVSKPTESFFFVFGAGHFLGNDSIIELMKDSDSGLDIVHINDTQQKHQLICDETSTKDAKRIMIMSNNDDEPHIGSSSSLIYPISPESYNTPLSYPMSNEYHRSTSDIATYYHDSLENHQPIPPLSANIARLWSMVVASHSNRAYQQQYWPYNSLNSFSLGHQSNHHQQQHQQRMFHSNVPYNNHPHPNAYNDLSLGLQQQPQAHKLHPVVLPYSWNYDKNLTDKLFGHHLQHRQHVHQYIENSPTFFASYAASNLQEMPPLFSSSVSRSRNQILIVWLATWLVLLITIEHVI